MHSLQLCVRDGLKNTPFIAKLLVKCQSLSKISHKSTKMTDVLDQMDRHISRSNMTRWNSEYLLIKSIWSIGKSDLDLVTSSIDNQIKFSQNDFVIFNELITILEPFHDISIRCQAEAAVTASLVVPSVVHLIVHLRDMKNEVSICSKLIQQLEASLNKRFSGIIDRLNRLNVSMESPFSDPLFFIATVLDPAFKFYWIRDLQMPPSAENHLKQHIIELILTEMKICNRSTVVLAAANISTAGSILTAAVPTIKGRKLFHYDSHNADASSQSVALDPAVELDAYLNDPVRSLFSNYWHCSQLNILKKLVVRIFSVQASSAPIERTFSQAGLVLSSKRTRMKENLFRDLVYLRVNQQLL